MEKLVIIRERKLIIGLVGWADITRHEMRSGCVRCDDHWKRDRKRMLRVCDVQKRDGVEEES